MNYRTNIRLVVVMTKDGETIKTTILAVSLDLFSHQGFGATTMRQIAEERVFS